MQGRMDADLGALAKEKAEREAAWEARRRKRLKSHAIVGAVLFFAFYFILGLLARLSLGWIVLSAILMAPVGALAGFLISWRRYGRFWGGLTGAGLFTAFMLVLSVIFGSIGSVDLFFLLAISLIGGGIPGIFIGIHVEGDS